ncbi:hypothetical protein SASPL_123849 [Salvia splendens]|uniref:Uncharacterized protein n=1 Tax=Salvia splendens TaxID=180675 RepID=A0A8X8XNY6_SALSN|nr:hypothetical protein SASPL_123849 [Salvia splendens]
MLVRQCFKVAPVDARQRSPAPAQNSGRCFILLSPVDRTARGCDCQYSAEAGAEGVLKRAQKVCTTWWKVSKDPDLWRVIDFSNPRQGIFNDEYNVMCRRAVDHSQGQLVDLTIHYFGDDALLDYIVQRSPNLKRLFFHIRI